MLTVANCRKEPVVLFHSRSGELTFLRKVPAGEAADVAAPADGRLLAVFLSVPYQEQRAVRDREVWLLRDGGGSVPPSPTLPAPPCSSSPARSTGLPTPPPAPLSCP
jgi:hypothetical protein